MTGIIPPSPNRPVTLGLYLLFLLSEGQLTDFHSILESLDPEELSDVFIKLPTDL
jgi:26S proteasome regulatory subunit N12